MPLDRFDRRISYFFLCATPFLVILVAAVRALRIPGVYHVIGGVLFAAIAVAVWTLGARAVRADAQSRRQLSIAGTLLIAPFAFVALLWVGLGPPWEATAAENQMRYLVLTAMAIAIASGFVVLRQALSEAGERVYSTLGFAATMLASPLYLVWLTFALGEWLGRGATRAFVIVSFVALLFLLIRGLQFPDPRALSEPWYTSPGFVAGIPAVPFIMPFLLGVVLLRRAGEE